MAKPDTIELLSRSTKVGPTLYISIYGHDVETFEKVTQRPAVQFNMLLNNLDILATYISGFSCTINICLRTPSKFDWRPDPENTSEKNPLLRRINTLFKSGKCVFPGNAQDYDNWGGLVTQQDVSDIDFYIRDSSETKTPKVGACSLIFKPIVMGDGRWAS